MPDTSRLFTLSLLALAIGTGFAVLGARGGAGAILSGAQWVELVTWLIGLQAGGAAGLKLAEPAGQALAAWARSLKAPSTDRDRT